MPRPQLYSYECPGCGDSFFRQGTVDDDFHHEIPLICVACAGHGDIVYYDVYPVTSPKRQ